MIRKALMIVCCLSIAFTAAFLTSGCGNSKGHVVAKVGDREIMLEEVNRVFDQAGARFVSAEKELETKRAFLDSLIHQNLLIIGAYEKNLENQEEVLRVVDGEKVKFLLDVLFEQKILSKATPSEAEVKDFYTRSSEEIKASHIVVETDSTAQEVLQKLKDGAAFEELALEYSIDPSAKRNQGDLGWFTWGTMVDEFQDAAFKMKPGEISAPVKTAYGYHIIKVVDRRPIEHRPEYSEMKDMIRAQIIDRRKRTLMQDYAAELEEKYPITVEKPTCEFVLTKLASLYPEMIGNTPRWRNNIDPAQLAPEEKALVLGSYNGGQLSLGDYLSNLRRVPSEKRPDFDNYDGLAEVIFQMSFMDILEKEAKDLGLEESRQYQDKILQFKELAMADVLRNDSIPYNVEIFEDEVRAYYDDHPDEFTTPLRFHLYEIQVREKEKAAEYARTISSEAQFTKIASQETLRPGKKQVSGDLGIIVRDQYPELFDAAAELKRGHLAGPIEFTNRHSVIWVKERLEPELQDFGLTQRRIVDLLTRQKGDKLYNEWIDEMKKRIQIEVYEDILTESIDYDKYTVTDTVETG